MGVPQSMSPWTTQKSAMGLAEQVGVLVKHGVHRKGKVVHKRSCSTLVKAVVPQMVHAISAMAVCIVAFRSHCDIKK